ncbi:hypothetical protein HDZ31DRAFT_81708 [Schizophyllum fasciatum]
MATNPSHILIARNSRGANNPSASLSPAETHAAAAGIFRSSGSPPWFLQECEADEVMSELSIDEDEQAIELDETFTKASKLPGNIKIVVESTTFWAHKEVLFFASPFFEAALSGNWAETGRPPSMSSVITISQPPSIPGDKKSHPARTEMTFAPVEPDIDSDVEPSADVDAGGPATSESESSDAELSPAEDKNAARDETLAKLQAPGGRRDSSSRGPYIRVPNNARRRAPDAVIILKEERASTFQDFLRYVYPHLECTITWNNVENLMNIAHKLCVPSLQAECLHFLITHAAGRPIKAMRIAELFEEEELYREASRFLLDNPGGWPDHELNTLSPETLLKLEKRRNWFLERVLKLGLVTMSKEYQCCQTCPDPAACARALEEKWRQAYQSAFRFGPPQPSMVYRYLRMLEGVSPPLALTHLSCQTSAKAFVATLFDRMFSLGLRGSAADAAPLARAAAAVAGTATAGPRRHFLYCTLKTEGPMKTRKSIS